MSIANPEKKYNKLAQDTKQLLEQNNRYMQIINHNVDLINENSDKLITYARGLPTKELGGTIESLTGYKTANDYEITHKLKFRDNFLKCTQKEGPEFKNPISWSDEEKAELINRYAQELFTKIRYNFPDEAENLNPLHFKNEINIFPFPKTGNSFRWYIDDMDKILDEIRNTIYQKVKLSQKKTGTAEDDDGDIEDYMEKDDYMDEDSDDPLIQDKLMRYVKKELEGDNKKLRQIVRKILSTGLNINVSVESTIQYLGDKPALYFEFITPDPIPEAEFKENRFKDFITSGEAKSGRLSGIKDSLKNTYGSYFNNAALEFKMRIFNQLFNIDENYLGETLSFYKNMNFHTFDFPKEHSKYFVIFYPDAKKQYAFPGLYYLLSLDDKDNLDTAMDKPINDIYTQLSLSLGKEGEGEEGEDEQGIEGSKSENAKLFNEINQKYMKAMIYYKDMKKDTDYMDDDLTQEAYSEYNSDTNPPGDIFGNPEESSVQLIEKIENLLYDLKIITEKISQYEGRSSDEGVPGSGGVEHAMKEINKNTTLHYYLWTFNIALFYYKSFEYLRKLFNKLAQNNLFQYKTNTEKGDEHYFSLGTDNEIKDRLVILKIISESSSIEKIPKSEWIKTKKYSAKNEVAGFEIISGRIENINEMLQEAYRVIDKTEWEGDEVTDGILDYMSSPGPGDVFKIGEQNKFNGFLCLFKLRINRGKLMNYHMQLNNKFKINAIIKKIENVIKSSVLQDNEMIDYALEDIEDMNKQIHEERLTEINKKFLISDMKINPEIAVDNELIQSINQITSKTYINLIGSIEKKITKLFNKNEMSLKNKVVAADNKPSTDFEYVLLADIVIPVYKEFMHKLTDSKMGVMGLKREKDDQDKPVINKESVNADFLSTIGEIGKSTIYERQTEQEQGGGADPLNIAGKIRNKVPFWCGDPDIKLLSFICSILYKLMKNAALFNENYEDHITNTIVTIFIYVSEYHREICLGKLINKVLIVGIPLVLSKGIYTFVKSAAAGNMDIAALLNKLGLGKFFIGSKFTFGTISSLFIGVCLVNFIKLTVLISLALAGLIAVGLIASKFTPGHFDLSNPLKGITFNKASQVIDEFKIEKEYSIRDEKYELQLSEYYAIEESPDKIMYLNKRARRSKEIKCPVTDLENAGVLVITNYNGRPHLVLAKSSKPRKRNGNWETFYGTYEKYHGTASFTAAEELFQESCGLFNLGMFGGRILDALSLASTPKDKRKDKIQYKKIPVSDGDDYGEFSAINVTNGKQNGYFILRIDDIFHKKSIFKEQYEQNKNAIQRLLRNADDPEKRYLNFMNETSELCLLPLDKLIETKRKFKIKDDDTFLYNTKIILPDKKTIKSKFKAEQQFKISEVKDIYRDGSKWGLVEKEHNDNRVEMLDKSQKKYATFDYKKFWICIGETPPIGTSPKYKEYLERIPDNYGKLLQEPGDSIECIPISSNYSGRPIITGQTGLNQIKDTLKSQLLDDPETTITKLVSNKFGSENYDFIVKSSERSEEDDTKDKDTIEINPKIQDIIKKIIMDGHPDTPPPTNPIIPKLLKNPLQRIQVVDEEAVVTEERGFKNFKLDGVISLRFYTNKEDDTKIEVIHDINTLSINDIFIIVPKKGSTDAENGINGMIDSIRPVNKIKMITDGTAGDVIKYTSGDGKKTDKYENPLKFKGEEQELSIGDIIFTHDCPKGKYYSKKSSEETGDKYKIYKRMLLTTFKEYYEKISNNINDLLNSIRSSNEVKVNLLDELVLNMHNYYELKESLDNSYVFKYGEFKQTIGTDKRTVESTKFIPKKYKVTKVDNFLTDESNHESNKKFVESYIEIRDEAKKLALSKIYWSTLNNLTDTSFNVSITAKNISEPYKEDTFDLITDGMIELYLPVKCQDDIDKKNILSGGGRVHNKNKVRTLNKRYKQSGGDPDDLDKKTDPYKHITLTELNKICSLYDIRSKTITNIIINSIYSVIEKKIANYLVNEVNIAKTFASNFTDLIDSILNINLTSEQINDLMKENDKNKLLGNLNNKYIDNLVDITEDKVLNVVKKNMLEKIKTGKVTQKGLRRELLNIDLHKQYYRENINAKVITKDNVLPKELVYEINNPNFGVFKKLREKFIDFGDIMDRKNELDENPNVAMVYRTRIYMYTGFYNLVYGQINNTKMSKLIVKEILTEMNPYFDVNYYIKYQNLISLCSLFDAYLVENEKNINGMLEGDRMKKEEKEEYYKILNLLRTTQNPSIMISYIFRCARSALDLFDRFYFLKENNLEVPPSQSSLHPEILKFITEEDAVTDETASNLMDLIKKVYERFKGYYKNNPLLSRLLPGKITERTYYNKRKDLQKNPGLRIGTLQNDDEELASGIAQSTQEGGGDGDDDPISEEIEDIGDIENMSDGSEQTTRMKQYTGTGIIEGVNTTNIKKLQNYYINDELPDFLTDAGIIGGEEGIQLFMNVLNEKHSWLLNLGQKMSGNTDNAAKNIIAKVTSKEYKVPHIKFSDEYLKKQESGKNSLKNKIKSSDNSGQLLKVLDNIKIIDDEDKYISEIYAIYQNRLNIEKDSGTKSKKQLLGGEFEKIRLEAEKIPFRNIITYVNKKYLEKMKKNDPTFNDRLEIKDNLKYDEARKIDAENEFSKKSKTVGLPDDDVTPEEIVNALDLMKFEIFLMDDLELIRTSDDVNVGHYQKLNTETKKEIERWVDMETSIRQQRSKDAKIEIPTFKDFIDNKIIIKNEKSYALAILGTKDSIILNPLEYTIWQNYEKQVKDIYYSIERSDTQISSVSNSNSKNEVREKFNTDGKSKLKLVLNNYFKTMIEEPDLVQVYESHIASEIDSMKDYYTNNFVINHLIFKEYLKFFINNFTANRNKIKNISKDLSKIDDYDSSLLKSNQEKKIIEIFIRNRLQNRINNIKEYVGKFTYKAFRNFDENRQIPLYRRYDFSEEEKKLFMLSVSQINKLEQDEIEKAKKEKEKLKKGLDWFGSKLKSLSLPDIKKSDIQSNLDELKNKIKKEKENKEEKLKLVNQIDSEKQKMNDLISKYESIQKINEDKLKQMQLERDNAESASKELLKNLEKYKKSRTELSIKAKELIMDRYKQLNQKKLLKEQAINDMVLKTQQMNIALDKLSQDHEMKIKELKEVEDLEISYQNERKKLEQQKLKMEIDRISMNNKRKKLDIREKRLKETESKLTSDLNLVYDNIPSLTGRYSDVSDDSLEDLLVNESELYETEEESVKTKKKKKKKKKKPKKNKKTVKK